MVCVGSNQTMDYINVVSNRDHIFVIRGEREWKEDLVAGGRPALPRHTPYRQGGAKQSNYNHCNYDTTIILKSACLAAQ